MRFIEETLDDFDNAVRWLLDGKHEWRLVEEAILGVISSIDKPGSPAGEAKDAFYFNWSLAVPREMQSTFVPSHQSMAALRLHGKQTAFETAVNLRAMFSGLVAGNVKAEGITDAQREKNLEMLHFISSLAKDRGLDFTLSVWQQIAWAQ